MIKDNYSYSALTAPERDDAALRASPSTGGAFGRKIQLCSIINIKSGGCANDCRFCAQSSSYQTGASVAPPLDAGEIINKITLLDNPYIAHIGLVAAGAKMNRRRLAIICEAVASLPLAVKNKLCFSFGTLDKKSLELVKAAGVRRYHHNLETSRDYYPQVCSTQSWQNRANTVRAALEAGLDVCSGCLFGLGESWDDRIDLARSLKELGVRNIPMNFLTPIPGTPFSSTPRLAADEIIQCVALFRHILPRASLRICAGRVSEEELGKLFEAGIDAMMTGDFLTTRGSALKRDLEILREYGYEAEAAD